MDITFKDPCYFNQEENQDYTFIYDSASNLPIFISNSLLTELSKKELDSKQKEVFHKIIDSPRNGSYSKENLEKGIYIKIEEEFNKIFDCI